MLPKYEHGCESCQFLTRRRVAGESVDWYVCKGKAGSSLNGTLLGRFGNEPHEYWSVPVSIIPGMSRGTDATDFMLTAISVAKEFCVV